MNFRLIYHLHYITSECVKVCDNVLSFKIFLQST
nr:MAG TPA: hypothetical protein [Caudoviricetes sp.]